MKTQPIINTNPYLKDAKSRERFVQRSVRTSCGVEDICEKAGTIEAFSIPSRGKKRIYKNLPK